MVCHGELARDEALFEAKLHPARPAKSLSTVEAERLRKAVVKVIGLANTDCDVSDLDYPVVINESSAAAIRLAMDYLLAAYERGLKSAQALPKTTPAPVSSPVLAI